jgi:Rad3-related DNA helicase
MDSLVICPGCGRPHTLEEFHDSRFCRHCGKFLSYRDRVKTPVRKGSTNREWPLFPYEAYPPQLDFMTDIKAVMSRRGVLVAEACNGFGKTVCALASLLPLGKRIVYATRTHEQVRQVLHEVTRINQISRSKVKAVNLASRQHLCLNDKCRTLSVIEAGEACRVLREAEDCPYKTESGSLLRLPPVLSTATLRREGERRKLCPYFLSRRVVEDSMVIVAPYQYVFNEHIRALVKLDLANKILVFDEAHNADQISQDVLSATLSERGLNSARKELDAIHVSAEFVDELAALLERKASGDVVIDSSAQLYEDLKDAVKTESLVSFATTYANAVDEIRRYKMDRGVYPMCSLNGVLTFLTLVETSPRSSYVAVYGRRFPASNSVQYRCLEPSLAIKPVVEEAYGALIMSGTLAPIELFAEILGLEAAETRGYAAIADPENVRVIIDPYVTTRFAERSAAMIRRIGERLSPLVAKIPHGVLIFFPQKRLMMETLSQWRRIGVVKGAGGRPTLEGKRVFVEGSRAAENRRIVEEYKKTAVRGNGAVLCGVFRGRNAEGSNFPYEEARGVVLVGVPYADYSDPVVKAQMRYYNRRRQGLGGKWYLMDAFKAANQAMGRGIRHRDDWCNFILMDQRYQTHQAYISRWALANGVQTRPPR